MSAIHASEQFTNEVIGLCGFTQSTYSGDFTKFMDALYDENDPKFRYFTPDNFMLGDYKNGDIEVTFQGVPLTFVEQKGGGEGGGESCYTVFIALGQHYRVDYSYRSHEGFDFDGASFREVTPVVRPVTFYE